MIRNPTLKLGQWWQLLLFALAHILIFALLFHTIYKLQYSAVGIYFNFGSKVLEGAWPYRDFALEYPPFSLLFFILPRLAASTWTTFSVYFQIEVVIFDLIGLFIIYLITRRLQKTPWKMLSIYTLGVLAMGPIVGQQYDIFPAVMSLLAIYCFWIGKPKSAWALLALGALTKIYPAFIAPVFLIYQYRSRQYKTMLLSLLTFAAVSLVILLPFLITDPASLWSLYSYHAQRGLQLESTYSSFLLTGDILGFNQVSTTFSFGSWNVTGQAANLMSKSSTIILALLLLATYWLVYRQEKSGRLQLERVGSYALLVVLITLIASKVLSPQYLIWIVPFLILVAGRWRYPVWIVFIIVGSLTYYIFPGLYLKLVFLQPVAVGVLLIRNILLILMALLIAGSLLDRKTSS